jgi:hypothetical protein
MKPPFAIIAAALQVAPGIIMNVLVATLKDKATPQKIQHVSRPGL